MGAFPRSTPRQALLSTTMSDHDDNGQPTTPGKRRHPTSEPEDEVDNNVNESQLSIDEEFQCGEALPQYMPVFFSLFYLIAICFDTMTDPYAGLFIIRCVRVFEITVCFSYPLSPYVR